MTNSFFDKKYFIAFAAFIAVFFVHGLQFFKKQTPLVNALLVGLVVYFVAGFFGFIEMHSVTTGTSTVPAKTTGTTVTTPPSGTTSDNYCCVESTGKVNTRAGECLSGEEFMAPTTAMTAAAAASDCTKVHQQYVTSTTPNLNWDSASGACKADFCQTFTDGNTTCSGTGCCTQGMQGSQSFTSGVPSGGCTSPAICSTADVCPTLAPHCPSGQKCCSTTTGKDISAVNGICPEGSACGTVAQCASVGKPPPVCPQGNVCCDGATGQSNPSDGKSACSGYDICLASQDDCFNNYGPICDQYSCQTKADITNWTCTGEGCCDLTTGVLNASATITNGVCTSLNNSCAANAAACTTMYEKGPFFPK